MTSGIILCTSRGEMSKAPSDNVVTMALPELAFIRAAKYSNTFIG